MIVAIPAAQRVQARRWLALTRPAHLMLFGAVSFTHRADAAAFKAAMKEADQ